MKTIAQTILTLAIIQSGLAVAQQTSSGLTEPAAPAKPTRAELKEKQLDVSLEARDIERVLGKLKKASDLAKERITEAAKTAESASTSLDKGDSKAARAEAQVTAEKFKEIVQQLEALLKEEVPQQIAEARQLAQKLAKAEREFAAQFPGVLNPVSANGTSKVDPRSQVKPMPDPDMKRRGSQNGGSGVGKSGEKKEGEQNSEKKDAEGKTGDQKDSTGGKLDQPGEKGSNDKPMPNGQGGKSEEKNKGGDKKDGAGGKPEGEKDAGKGAEKKTGEGGGKDPNENPNGGGDGSKKEKGTKPGEEADGTGGDKPDDKRRDGRGEGSNGDRRNEQDRNGIEGMTAEQRRELVANRAEQLAESGKTLQDVLNTIAKSTDPNDKEAVAKIQAVLKEIDIDKLVGELGQVSNMIRSKNDDDAKLASIDVAERLEIMAQRLDGAYRTLVAPQAEELRKVEAALAELREQLEKLETPSQVAAWHREVRDLLDKLEKLGVSPKDREFLEKEMTKAGFGLDVDRKNRAVNWSIVGNYYVYPAAYNFALIHLQEDIQERIQTLILGDLGNVSDDATPPKYQELVNRYYEVLSRSGKAAPVGKAAPAKTPEMRKPKGSK